jgi:hypothetical protein
MRTKALFVSAALAACGYPELPKLGGDAQGSGDDAGMTDGAGSGDDGGNIDAMPDAMHVCYTPATIQMLTLGSAAQPVGNDWFQTPTMGPNTGKKTFFVGGQLGQQAPVTVLAVEVVKPTAGYVVNQPYVFSTDANPNLAYTARAYLYGDYDTTNSTYKQYLYASNGSITFTAINDVSGSSINGTMSTVDFREVTETTGVVVPGGCTTQVMGMQFYLTQQ